MPTRTKIIIKVCPNKCKYGTIVKLAFYLPEFNFCPYCGKRLIEKEI